MLAVNQIVILSDCSGVCIQTKRCCFYSFDFLCSFRQDNLIRAVKFKLFTSFGNTNSMNNNIKKPYFIKDKIEKLVGSSKMPKGSLSEYSVNLPALGKQLLEAARLGKDEEVQLLLTKGAPFTSDWLGTSSLHLACMNGHCSTAEILIRAGVAFDGRTKMDKTPLHLAAQKGHHDIVNVLLNVNADINALDMLKMTPLHWAVTEKHFLVVKLLVANNAVLNIQSKFDKTPLDIAEDACDFHIVIFLKGAQEKTANYINEINENDGTSIQTTSHTDSGANSVLASLASLSSYNLDPLPWVTSELLNQSNASSSQLLLEGANVVTLTEAGKLALQTWSTLQEQEEQAAKEEEKHTSEIPSTSTPDSNDHKLLSITLANQMFTTPSKSSVKNNQPLTVLISPQRSIINGTKYFRSPPTKKRVISSHQRVPDADSGFVTSSFGYEDDEIGESMKEQLQRQLEAANSDAEHYREKLLIKEQEANLWRKKLELLHSGT